MPTNEALDIGAALNALLPVIAALGLAMARPFGLVAIFPVFTRIGLPMLLRGGVVFAMALPALPIMLAEVQAAPTLTPTLTVVLMLKEGLVGLLLGAAFGVPFWGAEAAGNIIDFQRGAATASIIDPSAEDASLLGTLFTLAIIALFVLASGFDVVIGGVYQSYRLWPSLSFLPALSAHSADVVLALLDHILRLAAVMAGPLVIAMFLVDFVLGLVGRFVPQLNAFNIGMSAKSLVVVLLLPIYAAFLIDQFGDAIAPLSRLVEQLQAFFR